MFQSFKFLKDECNSLGIMPATTIDGTINKLVEATGGIVRQGHHQQQHQPLKINLEDLKQAATKDLLQRSFQKHLIGKAKEHTLLGHELKEPIF